MIKDFIKKWALEETSDAAIADATADFIVGKIENAIYSGGTVDELNNILFNNWTIEKQTHPIVCDNDGYFEGWYKIPNTKYIINFND